jgi:hypothetical protein
MPSFKKIILPLLIITPIFWACDNLKTQHPTKVQRAFYYWKNELSEHDLDTVFMEKIGLQRLYIRLLDVDLDAEGQATPMSKAKINWAAMPQNVDIVPVVYIRNRVFQAKNLNIPLFSEQLSTYIISEMADKNLKEIQLDCDWSATTRKAYFDFINQFKKTIKASKSPSETIALSATIRLHQIKYRDKTGVPPVEKGALMLYNMDDVTKVNTKNSIFDAAICEQYLSKQKPYTLPLDVALPLFSWGIVFRQNQYKSLLNGLNTEGVSKMNFLKKTDETHYQVQKDTVFEGVYLRMGDDIRLETIQKEQLLASVKQAKAVINADTTNLIFYHLDKKILKNHTYESLETIYNSFN